MNPDDYKSSLEKIQAHRQLQEKMAQSAIDDEQEWAKVCLAIFSSPNGKLLAKYMLRHNRLFKVDSRQTPDMVIKDRERQAVYLELVRKYLPPEVRAEIENQD